MIQSDLEYPASHDDVVDQSCDELSEHKAPTDAKDGDAAFEKKSNHSSPSTNKPAANDSSSRSQTSSTRKETNSSPTVTSKL